MQKYNHSDLQDHHKINLLFDAGQSQTKIAQMIGVHKPAISREISRNVAPRGRWSVQGMDGVSYEAIYRWIWRGKALKDPDIADLYQHLNHGRRRCKRDNDNNFRGILTDRVGIGRRPEVVGEHTRLGNLEADFMMIKAHKSSLLVITDRAMLLTRLKKVDNRKADSGMGSKVIHQNPNCRASPKQSTYSKI